VQIAMNIIQIREELRKRDYLPVLYDFEKPTTKSVTETVSLLAHLARFVIADITDAKSILVRKNCARPGIHRCNNVL
jgi:hypothetical protein